MLIRDSRCSIQLPTKPGSLNKTSPKANLFTLAARLQSKIPHGHAVLTWLIRHLAIVWTIRMHGPDGCTAYERARGTPCSSKLLGFGEMCRYKCRAHGGTTAGGPTRWSAGDWLGLDVMTGQYIIGAPNFNGLRNSRSLFSFLRTGVILLLQA